MAGAEGAIAPQDGRIEGATHYNLPPSFRKLLTPLLGNDEYVNFPPIPYDFESSPALLIYIKLTFCSEKATEIMQRATSNDNDFILCPLLQH